MDNIKIDTLKLFVRRKYDFFFLTLDNDFDIFGTDKNSTY